MPRAECARACASCSRREASIATINTLLTHQGLTIVGGPGNAGNFTAELSADAVASGASAESVAAVIVEGSECHLRSTHCPLKKGPTEP